MQTFSLRARVLVCHNCKQLLKSVPKARLCRCCECVCHTVQYHTVQYVQIARNNTTRLHAALPGSLTKSSPTSNQVLQKQVSGSKSHALTLHSWAFRIPSEDLQTHHTHSISLEGTINGENRMVTAVMKVEEKGTLYCPRAGEKKSTSLRATSGHCCPPFFLY